MSAFEENGDRGLDTDLSKTERQIHPASFFLRETARASEVSVLKIEQRHAISRLSEETDKDLQTVNVNLRGSLVVQAGS